MRTNANTHRLLSFIIINECPALCKAFDRIRKIKFLRGDNRMSKEALIHEITFLIERMDLKTLEKARKYIAWIYCKIL